MATPTFYTHDEIVDVISDVNPFQNFLLNFFGMEHLSTTENIHFDRISPDKRIAVFVNPRRPGEVIKQRGFAVDSYKPGYIKDKRTVDHTHVFRRKAGTPMGAALSPSQRYDATVVDLALIQVDALYRRLEWMASELLLAGQYNMKGDDINVDIDFARDANKTIALTTTARWLSANSAVSPIDDVESWMETCTSPIRRIVFGKNSWKAFRNDPKFKDQVTIEATLGQTNLTQMPQKNWAEDVTYRGTLVGTGTELYTYTGSYDHPITGVDTNFVADDGILGVPDASYGYQCFSTIIDAAAGYASMPYFMKNWEEDDPGIPYLMLQSAPMLAHIKINATFGGTTGANGT